jgi:hypothetical protein
MKPMMLRAVIVTPVLSIVLGCASSAPPARPTARPIDGVRRVAIVGAGDSKFTVVEHRSEPGRTFDEVVKWTPHQWLRPFGALVHAGINWLLDSGRAATTAPDVAGVPSRIVVAEVVARRLQASGVFDEVRALEREPVGEERQRSDALLRVTVPAWGLVRVRQGPPDLLSAFADVRAQMVIRGTGVVVWESSEDVTHPERLPLESFTRDPRFARQQLIDVLERAGQQLASELVYARGDVR